MKILLIEDSDYKAKDITDTLAKLGQTDVTRTISRNGGLSTFINTQKSNTPFDFVISDNFMPLYDDSHETKPFAENIVSEIRRRGYVDTPICICSSSGISKFDYNYFILYDASISMTEKMQHIINSVIDITTGKLD